MTVINMIIAFFFILVLLPPAGTFAQSPDNYSDYGRLIKIRLSTAPFPHPFRSAGHTYKKTTYPADIHYSDNSVAIFIPKGFNPDDAVDFVFYFHGWYNNIDSSLAKFRIIEQFSESNKNAILIFPEGPRNSPDSFGGKFEDALGFKNFMNDILKYLREEAIIREKNIGAIVLSGHSGAYRIISSIISVGGLSTNIREVYLFDALYDRLDVFSNWIIENNGRFVNIFTPDGGTKDMSLLMIEDLTDRNISNLLMIESAVNEKVLTDFKVIFIDSPLGHNDVIAKNKQFYYYLKTSSLRNIK
ncbi:MAG: hypothetical protein AB9882_05515 [Ignavibacteriaceae bacterium]